MEYYLICNAGTFLKCTEARFYHRHFVLAQTLISDPILLIAAGSRGKAGAQMILDNGAYEGELCPSDRYLELTKILRPWCVVLPDLIGSPSLHSRGVSLAFAQKVPRECQMMYVPQGSSQEEVLDEYDWAVKNLDSGRYIIGLGKAYEMWGAGEKARIEMVTEIFLEKRSEDYRYHLLGARWKPTQWFAQHKRIIGMDTMKPCRCAIDDALYPRRGRHRINHSSTLVAESKALSLNIQALEEAYGCTS